LQKQADGFLVVTLVPGRDKVFVGREAVGFSGNHEVGKRRTRLFPEGFEIFSLAGLAVGRVFAAAPGGSNSRSSRNARSAAAGSLFSCNNAWVKIMRGLIALGSRAMAAANNSRARPKSFRANWPRARNTIISRFSGP